MVEQSPTRQPVFDQSLTVADYAELVADPSPTKCKTIAEHAASGGRLVGDRTSGGKLVAMDADVRG